MKLLMNRAPLFLIFLIAACSPDPYNLYPQSMKVEKIVMGESALELTPPRPTTPENTRPEYLLHEGIPYQDGGIVYKPFYLIDIEINPTLGSAILERKSRYTEIFGLLIKGAVGEASNGRLVPRVGIGELTILERRFIEQENADREVLIEAFMKGKQVPDHDHMAVRRVFAFSRYQLLPPGIWVEKTPGVWLIKGGEDYRARVMARDPVLIAEPSVDGTMEQPLPAAAPVIAEPRPRIRAAKPAPESESAEPEIEPEPLIEAPAPQVR